MGGREGGAALKETRRLDPVSKRPVGTCGEYLTGVPAPVCAAGAEHVVADQACVIVGLAAHVSGDEVHLSLPEDRGVVPQTYGGHC